MSRVPWIVSVVALALAGRALGQAAGGQYPVPAWGQRGQTVEVTASGRFDHWPPEVWTLGDGLEVTPGEEKGKLSVAIAEEAPIGLHWIRLHDEEGASALRPFLVGTLPEVIEAEPNDAVAKAQTIETAAVTVNGRLSEARGRGRLRRAAEPRSDARRLARSQQSAWLTDGRDPAGGVRATGSSWPRITTTTGSTRKSSSKAPPMARTSSACSRSRPSRTARSVSPGATIISIG